MDEAKTSVPIGSPVDARLRPAAEVPVGSWVAPMAEAMNKESWRPVVSRWSGSEYMTFFHTEASAGRASEMSKFPREDLVAWCQSRPRFSTEKGTAG